MPIQPASGYNSPGTAAVDATVGTIVPANINNIKAQDTVTSDATFGGGFSSIVDNSAKFYVNGAFTGSELADTTTHWPETNAGGVLTASNYGSGSSLSGSTPTVAQINATNFGFAISAKDISSSVVTEYYLATNFGFTIPSTATPVGLEAQVVKANTGTSGQFSFVAGTMIDTPRGNIPIEEVKRGDVVWSFKRGKRYEGVVLGNLSEVRPTVMVKTEYRTVRCTPGHRFYTGKGYKKVMNIAIGDFLYVNRAGIIAPEMLVSKGEIENSMVYHLHIEEYHNYFANGFAVHNAVVPLGSCVAVVDWIGVRVTYTVSPPNFMPYFHV